MKAINRINSKIDSETKRMRRLIRIRLVRMRLRLRGAIYMAKDSVWGRGKARGGMPGGGAPLCIAEVCERDVNLVPNASLSNMPRSNAHNVLIVALVCVAT